MDVIYIIYRVTDDGDEVYEHDIDFEFGAFRDFEEAKKVAAKEAAKCFGDKAEVVGKEFVCDDGNILYSYQSEDGMYEINVTPLELH